MARRESLAGQYHEVAKILGIVPVENSQGVSFNGDVDSFGRKVSLTEYWATPSVRVTELILRDPTTGRFEGGVDLVNGEFEPTSKGGINIVDAKGDSFVVNPNLPAKIHYGQPPARY